MAVYSENSSNRIWPREARLWRDKMSGSAANINNFKFFFGGKFSFLNLKRKRSSIG